MEHLGIIAAAAGRPCSDMRPPTLEAVVVAQREEVQCLQCLTVGEGSHCLIPSVLRERRPREADDNQAPRCMHACLLACLLGGLTLVEWVVGTRKDLYV